MMMGIRFMNPYGVNQQQNDLLFEGDTVTQNEPPCSGSNDIGRCRACNVLRAAKPMGAIWIVWPKLFVGTCEPRS